jgi:hypothetical protein
MRGTVHSRRSPLTSAHAKAKHDAAFGRHATRPSHIPWRVIRRTYREMISDRISLVAAGCAFYATLAVFPAISRVKQPSASALLLAH